MSAQRRLGLALSLAFALLLALPSVGAAQTLRWASQGDALTMDPHASNVSLTIGLNGQVYEALVAYDRSLNPAPALATEWVAVSPQLWRLKLRPGVKFHDGAPFTADDVIFSVQRANARTSKFRPQASRLGAVRKLDALTVEFDTGSFNPIFLDDLAYIVILNQAWCVANKATHPLDLGAKEEAHTARHANGTGPFVLNSRQPGIKTVYTRNPNWWGKPVGNVQEFVYLPIASDATRLAALISGDVDFVLDPPLRDIAKLRSLPSLKLVEGAEQRIIFLVMDQLRDSLLYGKAPGGRNPFQDIRVRRALYQAIDVEVIKTKLMNGYAQPTGGLTPSARVAQGDASLEARLPFDVAAARRLMIEAGYPEGFEVTLDCTNNRYLNDEKICVAVAAMWSQLKVRVRVNAMSSTQFFPKMDARDSSLSLAGWGETSSDPANIISAVFRSQRGDGIGQSNRGYSNPKFDELAAAADLATDPVKRQGLLRAALREFYDGVHLLPLHRQVIPWAMAARVTVVHRADNRLEVNWVTIAK